MSSPTAHWSAAAAEAHAAAKPPDTAAPLDRRRRSGIPGACQTFSTSRSQLEKDPNRQPRRQSARSCRTVRTALWAGLLLAALLAATAPPPGATAEAEPEEERLIGEQTRVCPSEQRHQQPGCCAAKHAAVRVVRLPHV